MTHDPASPLRAPEGAPVIGPTDGIDRAADVVLDVAVAVVGGGPAGAAVAIALAGAGVRIAVLERTDGGGNRVGESLPPSVTPLLHRLGAWDAVAATAPVAVHANRSVWGAAEVAERAFLAEPYGPGWRVDRRRFNAALLGEAERAGAAVWCGAEVRAVERTGDGWRLRLRPVASRTERERLRPRRHPELVEGSRAAEAGSLGCGSLVTGWGNHDPSLPKADDGDRVGWAMTERTGTRLAASPSDRQPPSAIRARFLVDATGRPARIARALGIPRLRCDRLAGVVAVLPPGVGGCDGATLVEAIADGWWYSGLTPDGSLVVAFFGDPGDLRSRRAWHPDGWRALLAAAPFTDERVARFRPAAPPMVVEAGSARLGQAAGDGWLAVGDAAACHDPLTSHGIGSALHHGPLAAAAILAHLAGDAEALPGWSRRVAANHDRCLDLLRAVYALETRWPDAPFWRSRRIAHPPELPLLVSPSA